MAGKLLPNLVIHLPGTLAGWSSSVLHFVKVVTQVFTLYHLRYAESAKVCEGKNIRVSCISGEGLVVPGETSVPRGRSWEPLNLHRKGSRTHMFISAGHLRDLL